MATHDRTRFEQNLDDLTSQLLTQIESCLECVPRLIAQYTADDGYHDTVDSIRERESACDRTNREIGALISTTGPRDLGIRLSQVNLQSGRLIHLYRLLDRVANAAEQFAEELAAIRPPRLDDCLSLLHDLARSAVRAMSNLTDVVAAYVRALATPDEELSVTASVGAIRALESEGDRLRNDCTEAAFRNATGTVPLVYRELALLLDGALDAIEDVTDQLLCLTGNEAWVDVEPTTDFWAADGQWFDH